MTRRSRNSGFTLIKLIVIIAIIAIIAAILFPVFAKVREKAQQTSCASNEKQLGLAFIQYSQDYNECLPVGNGTNSAGGPVGWAGPLYTYVKSTGGYHCPDDASTTTLSYLYNQSLIVSIGFAAPSSTSTQAGAVSPYNAAGTDVSTFAATVSPV